MQPVTENFKSVVNAAVRNLEVVVKLIGKNETDYTNARIYSSKDMLLSLKIVDGQTTGGFGLGGTICPSLTAELHKTAVVAVGDKVKVELIVYNGGGNLTMASEFTVDNMRRKGDGTLLVVALGSMVKLSKNYVSELTYPTTQLAVLEEIAEQTGYELHPLITTELINNPVIQTAPVKGKAEDGSTLYYTRREMLGYAAAINGGAAFIDQYGRIALARHNDTGEAFTHERVLQETISDPFEISAVKWNSSGLSYALGDDYNENTVEFYNPLNYSARELIAHNLETDLIGFGYDGAIIKKQGCGYFEVGDIVRYTDIGGTVHKLLILGIVYEFVGGYFSETLYSLTNTAMQREYAGNEVVSNQIGGGQAMQETTTTLQPLTSYSVLSDTSVQCNGRRYDIETDSTGLISRITDDLGGVLVPENVAAPADLALHNAVLWAVAISKGLASPQPSGEYVYICTDYDAEKKLWTNQSGAPPLDLSAALVNSDGIHGNVWWTVPVIPNPLGQFTFYAVARAADFDNLTGNWMNVIANEGATPQYNLTVRHKKWSIGTDEDTGYHWGDTYATEWRVLAVRRNGAVGEFYVDDSLQHSLSYCHPQIGDVDENFQINGVDFKFRYIGIFNEYHDDATLKAKIAELQQTYYTELPAVNDWKLLQSSSSGSYKTSETLSGAIPHSDTGYAMLVVSTRYELSLSDDSWELLTQSAVTNEGVEGLAKQSFFVYIKPLSEFDGSDYSVTVSATRFIWASLSYFTDAAKISVAHTSALSAQSWVTPAKTEPTKRLYLVTVTHEVTPSLQSAVDGTNISYIARTNTTRALMAYDYKPDMMSPLNIDTADSTSGQDCRAVLVLDIE